VADRFDGMSTRAEPLRRGLVSHCYRMLGSVGEAEQLAALSLKLGSEHSGTPYSGPMTDTDEFRRSLYGMATWECLAQARKRPLPTSLGGASDDPEGELAQRPEVTWLEPIPDALTDGRPIGLDVVAALQRLPARERAALILTEIEGWTPEQAAEAIGTTAAELEQAKSAYNPAPAHVADRPDVLHRYATAFEQYDVPAIAGFFTDDAIWEMPPYTSWFRGGRNIGRLISTHCPAKGPGDQVLLPIKANGQPGFAVYMRDPVENVHRAFQLQVLALTAAGIIHAVAFFDTTLFDAFSLPDLLTGLPEDPYDGRPRVHVERIHNQHN
jgi:RNA polymerase sigma-70 factor, ECF subfamily